jgi:predicted peroxiredoxin
MPTLLVSTAVGPADATRASIPFHIAANGAGPTGTECGLVLMGDATDLLKKEISEGVRGVGVPALTELFSACVERGFTFYV